MTHFCLVDFEILCVCGTCCFACFQNKEGTLCLFLHCRTEKARFACFQNREGTLYLFFRTEKAHFDCFQNREDTLCLFLEQKRHTLIVFRTEKAHFACLQNREGIFCLFLEQRRHTLRSAESSERSKISRYHVNNQLFRVILKFFSKNCMIIP